MIMLCYVRDYFIDIVEINYNSSIIVVDFDILLITHSYVFEKNYQNILRFDQHN